MKTRGLIVAALFALGIVGFASPASAAAGDKQVRFGLLYSNPTDDLSEDGSTTELDGAVGFQVSFEYGVNDLISVEGGISALTYDAEIEGPGDIETDLGEIDARTLAVNLNFYVKRTNKFDLFVGPMVGYTFWGDLETGDALLGDFSADDEFVFGAGAGIDVPFGSGKWAFTGRLNYTLSEVSLGGSSDLGVDPFEVSAGAAYRF